MYDVIIVGAGPAGASAGIFLAKAGRSTLLFDNGLSVTGRALIKNHYGTREITGPDLVDIGKDQAAKLGATIIAANVTDIRQQGAAFAVDTDQGTYEAQHIILATGLYANLAEHIGVHTKPGTEPRIKTIADVTPEGKTSIPGIWAAGTLAGVSMHTIITAGDGAKVAINLLSELEGSRHVDHDAFKPQQ